MSKILNAESDKYLTNNSYSAWTSQTLTPDNINQFQMQIQKFNSAHQTPEILNSKIEFCTKKITLSDAVEENLPLMSLQDTLSQRRSSREFQSVSISKNQFSYLLKTAVNANGKSHRSAPSAGALYPTQIYCVINFVEKIEPGIYLYDAANHTLLEIAIFSNPQKQYELLGFHQSNPPAVTFIYTSLFEDVQKKYGERGWRYIHFEVGQLMQNFHLVATSQGLASCSSGGGLDYEIMSALNTNSSIEVYMCALHVGHEQPPRQKSTLNP